MTWVHFHGQMRNSRKNAHPSLWQARKVLHPWALFCKTTVFLFLQSRCLLFHVSLPQLKSYDHHGPADHETLNGYCLYYFNHTDPHLLDNLTEDTLEQIFLLIAIIILWLIIVISVPAALYSVIPFKTAQNPTIDGRETFEAFVRILNKIDTYSIIAVFLLALLLDITFIGLNVWLRMNLEFTWFILCFDAVFIVLSIIEVVVILALAYHNRGKLKKYRTCVPYKVHILYAAAVFLLVMALQFLAFHGTFILLVFVFSPIPTTCFTLIYISALFSILCAVSIVIKVIHTCHDKKGKIGNERCRYAFLMIVAILFTFCVLPLDALIFIMLMRARLDYFGVSGFFGALAPTAIVSLIFFIGNKLTVKNEQEANQDIPYCSACRV